MYSSFSQKSTRRKMKSKYLGCQIVLPSRLMPRIPCPAQLLNSRITPIKSAPAGAISKCKWYGIIVKPNSRNPPAARCRAICRSRKSRSPIANSGVSRARFVVIKKMRSRVSIRRKRVTDGFYLAVRQPERREKAPGAPAQPGHPGLQQNPSAIAAPAVAQGARSFFDRGPEAVAYESLQSLR